MARSSDTRKDAGTADPRKERLKAALKANLARRKAQARARDAQAKPGGGKDTAPKA